MQNLLIKKQNLNTADKKTALPLKIKDIEAFYNTKSKDGLKIGLEYERLSLDKNTLQNASYDKVSKIIENFAKISDWELIFDEDTIIGAKSKDNTSVSLEPGCQMEISLAPKRDILDIDLELTKIVDLLDKIALAYDVIFLAYGISPVSSTSDIEIINKRRYKIMNNYLPYCKNSELCPKMMRQSAGIQINTDFKNSKDAYLKVKFFNMIMPFMTGLSANSPFENNRIQDNKSQRANVWLYTGENRCNFFYKDIFKEDFFKLDKYKNIFTNYINKILDVPMVYIEKEGKYIPIEGKITFREYIKCGFKGYSADINDYILHQSLCFPDVRLKNYIEIRNHDSKDPGYALALCALYKGLCNCDISYLIKKFSYIKIKDIEKYSTLAAQFGLDFKVNSKKDGWDVVCSLLNIAKNNLNAKDRSYLYPILDILKERKTSSDIILDYGFKNAFELVDFLM